MTEIRPKAAPTPVAKRTSAAEHDERRLEILQAALQLFGTNGFLQTGMEDIGRAVGLRGSALYYYFPSKTDILIAVTSAFGSGLRPTRKVPPGLSPVATLKAMVDVYIDTTVEHPLFMRIWLREGPHLPPELIERTRASQRSMIDEWTMSLGRVRSELTGSEARLIVNAALGVAHSIVFNPPRVPAAELKRVLNAAVLAVLLSTDLSASSEPA